MTTFPDVSDRRPGKRKQGLYFDADVVAEMRAEAERLNRPVSWLMQRAWRIARKHIATSRLTA